MLVLNNYEEVLKVVKSRRNISVDLGNLNHIDYTKAIDFLSAFKSSIKKISRSKFVFFYG